MKAYELSRIYPDEPAKNNEIIITEAEIDTKVEPAFREIFRIMQKDDCFQFVSVTYLFRLEVKCIS